MTRCPTLRTERLILRPFVERDLHDFTAVLQSTEVRTALHLPDTIGREDAWAQMASFRGQWELRGTGQWAVEVAESGEFIGRAGLHWPEREGWPGVECGWVLHPRHWGKGYATEAGRAAMHYAFDEVGVDEVFSLILPANAASQNVARRLGFTLRDERVLPFFPSHAHGIWSRRRGDPSPT